MDCCTGQNYNNVPGDTNEFLLDLNEESDADQNVWYKEDELFQDHIAEVQNKWPQIDNEIWAKVIILERNRRTGKIYIRTSSVTVNGMDIGFNGSFIGLNGFENPMRDKKTGEFLRCIDAGIKLKVDNSGNLWIKRLTSKCNIYIKDINSKFTRSTVGNDILKLPKQCVEFKKTCKLFDIKKFQSNLNRELCSVYPNRRRLIRQCFSAIVFVKSEENLLECPIWLLIINLEAFNLLHLKFLQLDRNCKYCLLDNNDKQCNCLECCEFCNDNVLLPNQTYDDERKCLLASNFYDDVTTTDSDNNKENSWKINEKKFEKSRQESPSCEESYYYTLKRSSHSKSKLSETESPSYDSIDLHIAEKVPVFDIRYNNLPIQLTYNYDNFSISSCGIPSRKSIIYIDDWD